MIENTPFISASFVIEGKELNLELITKKLEINPSQTRTIPKWPDKTVVPDCETEDLEDVLSSKTYWILKTEPTRSLAISDEIEKLLTVLIYKEIAINELRLKYNLKTFIGVSVHMEGENNPELYLSGEIIQFMATINAEFGIDLYVYSDEDGWAELEHN